MVKSACDTLLCIDMLNLIGRAQKMFQVPHNCKSCIPSLVTPPGSPRNPNRQDEMGVFSHLGWKGHRKVWFSKAFVTFVTAPVGSTYCTLSSFGYRK